MTLSSVMHIMIMCVHMSYGACNEGIRDNNGYNHLVEVSRVNPVCVCGCVCVIQLLFDELNAFNIIATLTSFI